MRKKIFKQTWAQKAVALGLSAAMVIPSSVAYLGTTTTVAAELPKPVAVYEAGATTDLDTTGINPDVVDATELWDGGKAWSLKDSVAEAAPSATTVKNSDCSITVKNPFAGDTSLVEPVTINKKTGLPEWNTGVTITYWVKTPGDPDKTSSIVSFKSEGVKTYEKNSMFKYGVASGYSEANAKDPTTEYYSYQLPDKYKVGEKEYPVYDFYEFAKAKGLDADDPFVLCDMKAVPQLVCVSPNFPKKADEAYFYFGKHKDGKPSEAFSENTVASLEQYIMHDNLKWPISYEDYKSLDAPGMLYGYVNGLLQLHTDNTMLFCEDVTQAKRYKNDGTEADGNGIISENNINFFECQDDETSPEADTEWHFVAYVIQNDYMYSVIDGETVIDQTMNGASYVDVKKSFNLGTGLLANAGFGGSACEEDGRYKYNPNRNAKSIMEWLTAETTKLNIGGSSLESMSVYQNIGTTAGTQIACVKMYNEVLDEDTIAAIYAANDSHPKTEPTETPGTETPGTETPGTATPGTETPGTATPGTETPGTATPGTETPGTATPGTETPGTETPGTDTPFMYGDVDGNGRVEAQDALKVLRNVVKLENFNETQTKAGDVNVDGSISAQDALVILQYVVKIIPALPVK